MSIVKASHIVWDWNGTLLHDNEVVLAAVNDVCAEFGRAPLRWEEWQQFIAGHGLTDLFQRVDGLPGTLGGESKTDHLIRHLEAQNLSPADVVLIGDVVDDAQAAQAVGAPCILVAGGAMTRQALESTGVPVTNTIREAMQYVVPA
ncbi:HAD hydrolase-like protein [Kribbella sp. NPDC051718]|uniref:HAD family hydrolase n=1 Tax=Kribbella sp. NPDC051718 TaxID=3155168 RepID=UPI00342F6599